MEVHRVMLMFVLVVLLSAQLIVCSSNLIGCGGYYVTTLAGHAASPGGSDGTLAGAQFIYPNGLTIVHPLIPHVLFVSEERGCRIRRIDLQTDNVTTLIGTSPPDCVTLDGDITVARMTNSSGLAFSVVHNSLFFTEHNSIRCLHFESDDTEAINPSHVSTLAGSEIAGFQDGLLSEARFNSPSGLFVSSSIMTEIDPSEELIFVADSGNHRIRMINLQHDNITTVAGTGQPQFSDGMGISASFHFPSAMSIDPRTGDAAFIIDSENNAIRKMSLRTFQVTTVLFGNNGLKDGPLDDALINKPTGIAVDFGGNILITENLANCVRTISLTDGTICTLAGSLDGQFGSTNGNGTVARFHAPRSIAVVPTGEMLVTDSGNHLVRSLIPETPIVFPDKSSKYVHNVSRIMIHGAALCKDCEMTVGITCMDIKLIDSMAVEYPCIQIPPNCPEPAFQTECDVDFSNKPSPGPLNVSVSVSLSNYCGCDIIGTSLPVQIGFMFEDTFYVDSIPTNRIAQTAQYVVIRGQFVNSSVPSDYRVQLNRNATCDPTFLTADRHELHCKIQQSPDSPGPLFATVRAFGAQVTSVQIGNVTTVPTVKRNDANKLALNAHHFSIQLEDSIDQLSAEDVSVSLSSGSCSISALTLSHLECNFTVAPSALGPLTAHLSLFGGDTNSEVVATIVNPPQIISSNSSFSISDTQLLIKGSSFSTIPQENVVILSQSSGHPNCTVVSSNSTLLNCSVSSGLQVGTLYAVVQLYGGDSGAAISVAIVIDPSAHSSSSGNGTDDSIWGTILTSFLIFLLLLLIVILVTIFVIVVVIVIIVIVSRQQRPSGRTVTRTRNSSHRSAELEDVSRSSTSSISEINKPPTEKQRSQSSGPRNLELPEIPYSRLIMAHTTPIATGSISEIYKASYNGATVVFKRLMLDFQNPSNMETFRKEMKNIVDLKHQNIIQFYGVVSSSGIFGIVTEFADNGTLETLIRNEKLPWERKLSILKGIATGVAYIHSQGYLHRDLRTKYILITKNYTPKIAGLGVMRIKEKAHRNPQQRSCYIAPEIAQGNKHDIKTDVYGFSLIMYELLTEHEPFHELSDRNSLAVQFESNPELRPQLPDLEDLVKTVFGDVRFGAQDNQFSVAFLNNYVQLMKECWDPDPSWRPTFEIVQQRLESLAII